MQSLDYAIKQSVRSYKKESGVRFRLEDLACHAKRSRARKHFIRLLTICRSF
jgi:hypothetical protein